MQTECAWIPSPPHIMPCFPMGTPRHALILARSGELRPTVEHVKVQNMILNITYEPPKADPNWAAAERQLHRCEV